ncbi:MAG: CerR family C-terminal domain-containing protein [Pyrinomonadaceae bacterium]|nr:CerR family C-terminal domain-containing protein [Phycisphaerales bacterium]
MTDSPTNPQADLASHSEQDTRQRLLDAAGRVFADQGFRDATVREICSLAGVNIASVNYHFRDKQGLYREVIQYAASEALTKYPPGGGVTERAEPEERLRAFIQNYLNRLLDEGRPAWHGMLIAREMVQPTAVLDELAQTFVRPQYLRVRGIVTDLLQDAATDDRVRFCTCSVVSQCLFYKNCRPIIERVMPEHRYDADTRGRLAEHIATVCIAGIEAVRLAATGDVMKGGAG